jgi:hypothetical protein
LQPLLLQQDPSQTQQVFRTPEISCGPIDRNPMVSDLEILQAMTLAYGALSTCFQTFR